jgi:hypothetical protein
MADERPGDNRKGNPEGPREEGQGRRGGRHRGFRGRHGAGDSGPVPAKAAPNGARPGGPPKDSSPRDEPQRPRGQKNEEPREMPLCSICGKAVYDLSTAISASREMGEPAHFDCVLERVIASETLAAGEKLVYLGSGSFGVVEFKDKVDSAFQVKRRIQWEKEGEKKDWRKGLSSRISNL